MGEGSERVSGSRASTGAAVSQAEVPGLREAVAQFLRLFELIRAYWRPLLQSLAIGLILGLLALVLPFLTKMLIDEVYPSEDLRLMHLIVVAVLAVGVASAVLSGIRGYFTQVVSARLNGATTLMFFNHLQHLPIRFFEQHRVGEITSRFQDVRNSLGAVSQVLETLLVRGVYLILVPPVLFLLSWKLAIITLVTVPLTALLSMVTARLVRKYWKRSAEAHADLSAFHVEVFSQIRTMKSLGLETSLFKKARGQVEHALRQQLTASGLTIAVRSANGFLRAAGGALTTWVAWTLILRQEMTLGSYVAFTSYLVYLTGPITEVASLFSSFQQTAITLARMFEYLDIAPEQDPRNAYSDLAPVRIPLRGAIRVRNVFFGYTSEKYVLHDIALDIAPGEVMAIVGPNGAGKSALFRLLARLDEPGRGEILFDGRPAREIPLAEVRRQVAVVWQDVALLKGTIWENLVLGDPSASRPAVEEAVHICRLHELIAELPRGYETPVAEWGTSLSGGQRQRVAIARALIQNAPILLLDEATSNLDVETELEIFQALLPAVRDRTVLFTTHRVANAGLADRVLVLHEGRVVACGAHSELIQDSEPYRRMQAIAAATEESRRLRVIGSPS